LKGSGAAGTGTSTLLVVLNELVQRLHQGETALPVPVTGTATGGSTTTLIDDKKLLYSSADANAFDGIHVYQETDGETTRVTRGGNAGSTGTLTLSPAVVTFGSGTPKYMLSRWHIDVLKNNVNAVLRNTYMETIFPLSSLLMTSDDNDMESAPNSSYTASNSNLAKETTIVFNGGASLSVTATATGGYATTGNITVNEGQNYYVSVLESTTSGDSGTLRVFDVTNSASIDTAASDEIAYGDLAFQFSTPSGCEQIERRMISDATTDITFWDDLVLFDLEQRVFKLPSWVK